MTTSDNELKRRFVIAVDQVLLPAPALAARVADSLRLERRHNPASGFPGRGIELGPAMRLAAGLVAVVVAISVVATLMYTAGAHQPIAPARQPTLGDYRFTPSATTRSASWPAGGPVLAGLAGCWKSEIHPNDPRLEVCLGQYSFDVGQGSSVGNVVVNGSEIVFFSAVCNMNQSLAGDRYLYTVTGNTLVLTLRSKVIPEGVGLADQTSCGWELAGSYVRVSGT